MEDCEHFMNSTDIFPMINKFKNFLQPYPIPCVWCNNTKQEIQIYFLSEIRI